MKQLRYPLLLILFQVLCITGCASSKLHMELSIYKDDPLFKNVLTQDDIKATEIYLAEVDSQIEFAVLMQINVSDASYRLFDNYWMAQGEVETKSKGLVFNDAVRQDQIDALVPLKSRLLDYQSKLYVKADDVRKRLAEAMATYAQLLAMLPAELEDIDFTSSSYIGQLQRQQRLQKTLSIEVTKVHQAFGALIEDRNHPFFQSTQKRWGLVSSLIRSQNYENLLSAVRRKELNNELINVAKSFKQVQSTLITLRPEISGGVELAIETNQTLNLVNSMMKNPTTHNFSGNETSQMLTAVDLLNSQLDRLQVASSPAWRIVTDPKNKNKWNTEFSESYFYAEGNAGVVIVRDSPIKYRVQEASNNPAALVQAQLQVSRAVADAAIQIAGATTGAPLASLSSGQNDSSPKPEDINDQQDTETMMTKQARLKAKKVVYQRSIAAIEANIDGFIRQLKELEPASQSDKDERNDQVKINNLKIVILQYLQAQDALMTNTVNLGGK
jgi:hypothetical protein